MNLASDKSFPGYAFSACLLAVSLCVACASHARQGPGPKENEAPARVIVKQVKERKLKRLLPISGRVHSRNDVELSVTIAGELERVVEPGTRVAKGEVVAHLDARSILLRKKELEIGASRVQVNLGYLEKELARLQKLRETNSASQRLLDEAESQRDLAQSDLAASRNLIRQVDDELRRSRVIATFSGVVVQRYLEAGEYVQPGDNILRLVDDKHLEVRFEVPASYYSRINVGDLLDLEGWGNVALQGIARAIIPAVDENSQTFEVRADIVDAPPAIIVGQLIVISLGITSGHVALMIPRDALVLSTEGSHVYRIGQDNTAQKIAVAVGEGERDWVSVTGGLHSGDWIAVRGAERLKDGQAVSRTGS